MGLDQYMIAQKGEEFEEIGLWRKHANLQGWMEKLAVKKGLVNNPKDFNCIDMYLTRDDLIDLELDIKNDNLPHTRGFFFGESYGDDAEKQQDLLYVENAKQYSDMNWDIIYKCWW